jgi:peptide/nickel transport system substrate-binding protein
VTDDGLDGAVRRNRMASLWQQHRARWTLPLVIIVIIGAVAVLDHLGSHRIAQVNRQKPAVLVPAKGGSTTVALDQPWNGFNPNTPWGATSTTPTLLDSVYPSAYVVDPSLVPEVNSSLLLGVETTSTNPLTIQYSINPRAVWSDGVPVSATDFVYAWETQRGDGVDVDGTPDQVASTLGYRDIASVTSHNNGKTVVVTFARPFTDWRSLFDHLVPAHVATQAGWNAGFQSFDPSRVLSAGPMELRSATANTAVLVRNPKWWGTPSILDRITVSVSSSPNAWTGQLTGSNHSVVAPNDVDLGGLAAITAMPNTHSQVNPALSFVDLEFNTKSPVMSRVAAREAVAHLVDRPALLDRTVGVVSTSLTISDDHLAVPGQPEYARSSAAGDYDLPDPATAVRLLRSVGYVEDAAGRFVDAAGTPLQVRLATETGDPWVSAVSSELTAELRSQGIGVIVVPVAGIDGLRLAAAANAYDLALVERSSGSFQTQTATWFSADPGLMAPTDSQDWSRFDDPAVDALFSQAARALNPVTGAALYGQIDDQLWDQMVALPLFGEPGLLADGPLIANVVYNDTADGILWNAASWSILRPESPARAA